jgi:hypothetical protein
MSLRGWFGMVDLVLGGLSTGLLCVYNLLT